MFKDDSFKNSEAKKEYVKIKYAKNGWVTEQRKIPRIKIKRQEQGDFEMKERKHRALMQEIQYSSNIESQEEKTKAKETKTLSTGEKRVWEEKEKFFHLERDLTVFSSQPWTESMERDHHSECQSTGDKDCIGTASKERNMKHVSKSRYMPVSTPCKLRWVSDPDGLGSNLGSHTCRCVILASLSGPQSPHL